MDDVDGLARYGSLFVSDHRSPRAEDAKGVKGTCAEHRGQEYGLYPLRAAAHNQTV